MEINRDSEYLIQQRQEGKDVLSWIENFGLHLLEEDCKPKVPFQKGGNDLVLVLRIRNKYEKTSENGVDKNTISAYLCFFKTTDNGFTRFCINAACDEDVEGLKGLMQKAKWKEESTRNWWNEVFHDLKHPIDEDILRREEVLASESLKMNMMDFIEKIQGIIGKAITKLGIDHQEISKVLIAEQFAMALPIRYAIERMFPNANGNVFPIVWKENKMSWLQNKNRFHVPEELMRTTFLTSPKISISDILNLEKGIIITHPLSKDGDEKYYLPSTSIFENSNLKWNDFLREDVAPEYIVDGLAFRRLQITILADGFQNVCITCMGQTFFTVLKNGKLETLYHKSQKDKPQVSEPILPESSSPLTLTPEPETTTPIVSNAQVKTSSVVEGVTSPTTSTTTPSPDVSLTLTESDIAYDMKCEYIHNAVDNALTRTLRFLEEIACSFLNKLYPNNDWKEKYGEAIKGRNGDEETEWYKTWKDNKKIEFSNFLSFLWFYEKQIKNGPKRAIWWKSCSDIESAVKYLILIRNFTTHQRLNIVGIGYRYLSRAFDDMIKIAVKLQNQKLEEQLNNYLSIFEKYYDTSIKEKLDTDPSLQEVYKLFEIKIKK